MLRWYICPDGENVDIQGCLKSCRMEQRCMSLPSLIVLSEFRPWKGVSASMAGKGNRQIYLEQTTDHARDPRESVFMLYGTRHHALKEDAAKNLNAFIEEDEIHTDYFSHKEIIDYKLCGGYAVAKRMNMEEIQDGVYQRSGRRGDKTWTEGEPKYRTVWTGEWDIKPDDPWALQQNRYRMEWEKRGYEVERMTIEATIRDGGLQQSRKGVDSKVYMIPMPLIEDEAVSEYYDIKGAVVEHALDTKTSPGLCTQEERWNGRRCEGYCPVWAACLKVGGWDEKEKTKLIEIQTS